MSEPDSIWPETQWSLIGRAHANPRPDDAARAWQELISIYRVPIARVLHRYLAGLPNSEEAVAVFFGYLFENRIVAKPSESMGLFRAYIQAVARNFAHRWRNQEIASARVATLPLDIEQVELDHGAWIPTFMAQAMAQIGKEDAELLRDFYGIDREGECRGELLARKLDIRIDAVYQRLHAARSRLRVELGRILKDLAATEDAWKDEMKWVDDMLEKLGSGRGQQLDD